MEEPKALKQETPDFSQGSSHKVVENHNHIEKQKGGDVKLKIC